MSRYRLESIGINVKIAPLAAGLYQLIKDHPDGDCMRVGMFPAEIMESLDRMLEEKIPNTFYSKKLNQVVDYGQELRKDLTHEICSKILELATVEGYCIA